MACALTTLAHVKAWLGIPDDQTDGDANLQRLIQSASRFILSTIQRSTVCVQDYSELYDGNGKTWMLLKQWPITALASINFRGGPSITTQLDGVSPGSGFVLNPQDSPDEGPQRVTLWGYCFPYGRDTVQVNYTAGFQQSDELVVLKAGVDPDFFYTVALTQTWAGDIEVLDEFGIAMLKVDGSPGVGEYSVSALGEYRFNAAAEGDTITVVYSYIPADLEEACYELVSEGVRYQSRIGIKSKTLGGQETVVYDNSFMSDRITSLLQNYRRVAPI